MLDTAPARAPETELAAGVRLLARVERESRTLRGLDLPSAQPGIAGAWALRRGLEAGDLHFELPSPAGDAHEGLPPVQADVVLLGRASSDRIRLRAFYLEARLTVALHGRLPIGTRSGLLAGAAVLDRVGGRSRLVLPEVIERGRRLRHAWVVERLLPGRRFTKPQWTAAAPALAGELAELWVAGCISRVPAQDVLSARALRSFAELLAADAPETGWRHLGSRVRELAAGGEVVVGWCHGDPVHGNWLTLPDGRAALVDWELARRRPIGHDAMKLLVGLPDPLAILESADRRLAPVAARGDAPFRLQVAVSLAGWLAGWRRDRAIAARSAALPAYHRRLRQRLDLLDLLTTP